VSEAALVATARLVRRFHDLTAGTSMASDGEVLCHHDLAPNNTVYETAPDGLRPYAFVDWDRAGPGRRIEDVAHVCWMWLDLGPDLPDIATAAGRIRVVLAAYGAEFSAHEVVSVVVWWQERCWRGIEAHAESGDPAMLKLVSDGTASRVRAASAWTARHVADLASG
jgi:aminoglycoside phosphotransferase (APT) family kinase protein